MMSVPVWLACAGVFCPGAVADLRRCEGRASPRGSKFFQFHAVFGNIWQNLMLAPPGELVPPPRGNPGSATEGVSVWRSLSMGSQSRGLCMETP